MPAIAYDRMGLIIRLTPAEVKRIRGAGNIEQNVEGVMLPTLAGTLPRPGLADATNAMMKAFFKANENLIALNDRGSGLRVTVPLLALAMNRAEEIMITPLRPLPVFIPQANTRTGMSARDIQETELAFVRPMVPPRRPTVIGN